MLHTLYGRLALTRRAWYERPGARRRLSRPVISVGNLSVGGTGKTPLVAAIATWLVAIGERPAILSRGYARTVTSRDATVVSDGTRIRTDVAHAGDEPLMLARAVPGAAVVVCAERHAAGVVAEETLGATIHLLDDGFQHLPLARDLDIVVTAAGTLATDAVLPKGERADIPGRMNLSAGGAMVLEAAPPVAAAALAGKAAAALGLRVAAVDLFTDIAGQADAMTVIEVNSNPSIRLLEDSGRDDLILRLWHHTFFTTGLLGV